MADALSHITTHLDPDMVRSILDGIILEAAHKAEIYDPTVAEGDHDLEQEVHVTAQREDPVLSAVLDWMEVQKKTDLKTLLGEHTSSEEAN